MEPVFANTLELCKNITIEPSVRYCGLLNDIPIINNTNNIVKVNVVNADCIDTCIRFITENPEARVGLLNMASERKPGGGVLGRNEGNQRITIINAQEETRDKKI